MWGLGAGNETAVVLSCSGTTKAMWLAVIRLRLQSALALAVKKQERVSCTCTVSQAEEMFVSFPLFTTGFRSCQNLSVQRVRNSCRLRGLPLHRTGVGETGYIAPFTKLRTSGHDRGEYL